MVIPYISAQQALSEVIRTVEGGIVISKTEVNKTDYQYRYVPEFQRFRLVSVSVTDRNGDHLCGEWSLDLPEQLFQASVTFDPRTENPEEMTIRTAIYNDPVWLDEPVEYVMPGYEFFSDWRRAWTLAVSPDTVTYIGFNMDYDEQEFIGLKKGEYYSCPGGYGDGIHKGDTVIVYISTSGYQPEGDKMLLMVLNFIHIDRVYAPGKLTRFYETNRKQITYEGSHEDHWRYEERCPVDIDYFLAYTTEQTITDYLQAPGILQVVFSEPEEEYREYNIKAELYNVDGENRKFICRILMMHQDVFTDYYLWNEENSRYELSWSDFDFNREEI